MDSKAPLEITSPLGNRCPQAGEAPSYDDATLRYTARMPAHAGRLAFWKVTAIGLCIGTALGLGSYMLLQALGITPDAGLHYVISVTAGGLAAAGILLHSRHGRTMSGPDRKIIIQSPVSTQVIDKKEDFIKSSIATVVYDGYAFYPSSDTHGREEGLAQARQALLSMDTTKAISH